MMKKHKAPTNDFSSVPVAQSLQNALQAVSDSCINCKFCKQECAFLQEYGKPKQIADGYDPADKTYRSMAFECSLCQLCSAVCPVEINPAEMFLEMRREAVRTGEGDLPEHGSILAYEKRGTSKRYSYYALPKGCDTVFFPGCTLPGTRPHRTREIFEHIRKTVPTLGLVLDCCTKPSHDLGREHYFHAMFGEMKEYLIKNGIRKVLVACPNCYKIFQRYGGELTVSTVYEFLAQDGLPTNKTLSGNIAVHDPCGVRYETAIHDAVRSLCRRQNLAIEEMPHHKEKTLCCGEGGSVGFITPEYAKKWGRLRQNETNGNRLITYCAGCANFLGGVTPTSHLVDLLFEPEATMAGKVNVSKTPFTYLNRLKLKKRFRNEITDAVTRERTFTVDEETKKGGLVKRLVFIAFIIGAILAIRFSGATQYLEQEKLRALIMSYGALAPVIYMLIYTVAPALFLPGLPITIVGGILFGPVWGVVYTITASTAGACVAFLVSRYIARDWIASKLKSPRWRRLDESVERHGWKVVAFTRLIPAFPFNLLNYAFGLTKVKFFHYAVTTFFCMLPACIAFIVFSSSLLDVLRGQISPTFVAGVLLIIGVSLVPVLYKRFKAKKESQRKDPSPATEKPTPTQKKTLIKKALALLVLSGLAYGGYKLVMYYWYILNSYFYTLEFYILFVANNLKSANLEMFKECLVCMNPIGLGFPMVLYSHFVQNFWLPFTEQILPLAATTSYGFGIGSLFTYGSFLIVGMTAFGLGLFFLGDIVPFIRSKIRRDDTRSTSKISIISVAVLLAVPYIPISVSGLAAGAIRIPLKRIVTVMALGLALRAIWLFSFPSIFVQ